MLASRGMRTAFRLITHSSPSSKGGGGRSIHLPSGVLGRKPPLPTSGGSARNVLQQARNALARLIFGGATPGVSSSVNNGARTFARGLHRISYQHQLSLPARHALTNPLTFAAPKLPRAPVVQRGVTQVGLGSAKQFSTARPIFQNLVDNVPVSARALWEVDLDVEKKRAKKLRRFDAKKENSKKVKKGKTAKLAKNIEFERYFPSVELEVNEEVTTYLTVPLHPTSSSTPAVQDTTVGLLPFQALADTHNAHTTHAQRITSLFLRLEQGRVWQRGAHYEAFTTSAYPYEDRGVCERIRIVFDGWTQERVRGVIGEAGIGWCELYEVRRPGKNKDGRVPPVSLDSSRAPSVWGGGEEESAREEFVMPTLDFSSSFLSIHNPQVTAYEDPSFPAQETKTGFSTPSFSSSGGSDSDIDMENMSISDRESEWHWSSRPITPVSTLGVGFSAEFMDRAQDLNLV